ncbi:MAG: hypothetical protein P1V51_05760 [Deltaproteobacteria bacterium]|nr:hypothetical protein [Deltaproteobacteria bacterium]
MMTPILDDLPETPDARPRPPSRWRKRLRRATLVLAGLSLLGLGFLHFFGDNVRALFLYSGDICPGPHHEISAHENGRALREVAYVGWDLEPSPGRPATSRRARTLEEHRLARLKAEEIWRSTALRAQEMARREAAFDRSRQSVWSYRYPPNDPWKAP